MIAMLNNCETRTIKTICGICNGACGICLELSGGVITSIKGDQDDPFTNGYICPKGKALKELVYAPDRLTKPLKKVAPGEWRDISWEDAFAYIVSKLKELKLNYGPESLAIHVGQTGVRKEFTNYLERFAAVYGTPNCSSAGSHCHISKSMANEITYGILPAADYLNSNCIVLWGYNPANACPPQMNNINKARARGARLIVVDPTVTPAALSADIHLQQRPGSDGALALGMLYVIVNEELYDKNFVAEWTIGFDKLQELVKEYTPEITEKITWVPAAKIVEAARLFAQTSPANISPGISLELQTNGFQTARALAILQAVTGNLDITGGALFVPPAKLSSLEIPIKEAKKPAIGEKEFPVFHKYTKRAQANIYYKSILKGDPYHIKGMIVDGSNPVLTWPNASKVKEALSSLELLLVIDHFMTETGRLADLVLPAATFLGRYELRDASSTYGVQGISLIDKVLEDEGITDWKFWNELARRMGHEEHFPWPNEVDALNFRLKPLGLSYDQLKDNGLGYVYSEKEEKKYEKAGFKTLSGKVEIFSQELADYGFDPLPVYREPGESPLTSPQVAEKYPLILSTGARTIGYYHSRYRNIESLRKLLPEPLLLVHPAKAEEMGICDGETVKVESMRGSIEMKVSFSTKFDPRVIFAPHGWDKANSNILTDSEVLDPVSGFPPDRALLARIVKIEK
ncbi:molybdopterin-dependent oxidoreductase [Pelotomaculum isophthalicicum JI]|uniref:Molybdopterin-dependent oxidoreductase n=1 Tax=Pelotomaculum isophthalicicum JI TaxID=947010 RepID=A0A9X4H5K6_9FIRM|nr:molybdopterin-dependent oxidoreductase [Pelotomaculum isophthalicicum]MDF9407694.1 molybdopterin-dependent oxidoreductase [Pelotomaculum isophthalicicum JI]